MNLNLSIIILSYQSKKDLEVLLPSVWESSGISFDETNAALKYTAEVIVVDNGSSDGTYIWLEDKFKDLKFKNIKIIKNQNNGFAAGNNLGIKEARGENILILNPDTKLEPDTLKVTLDFLTSKKNAGMVGCKILLKDGKLDLACRRRFPNPLNSFKRLFLLNNKDYNYSNISEDQEMEVDSIVGAFMMVKKEVIEKIGLFDEDFFMYGEDLDWCWRCKQAGFKVWYLPKTFITHNKGSSSAKVSRKALLWFHEAMWIFYKKHYKNSYPFYLNWLVFLGIYFRYFLLVIVNFFKKNAKVCG